eukprot:SAG31_NODE_3449_length_4257_cov_2.277297_4_plen_99_part_00
MISDSSGVPVLQFGTTQVLQQKAADVVAKYGWTSLFESCDTDGSGELDRDGKGCYFLVFVQLFEKYGTLMERNTALIEKVSPCRVHFRRPRAAGNRRQ